MPPEVAPVVIRFANPDDAGAIAGIHAASWRRHYRGMYSDRYLDGDLDADRLAAWTDRLSRGDRHFTLLAESGGRPVGFAHVALDADPRWGALVDNLHVAHTAQGSGVGSLLLHHVARIVLDRRPGSGIYLWVLEQNEAAKGFYVARQGVLQDSELAAPPGNDPRNLHGSPRRVRVAWWDPRSLFLKPATREKVRWGVLGAANIAVKKVIPAMQRGDWSRVDGLASRDIARARTVAATLGVPSVYGSYDELLEDPAIEAVYIPLPNHLHVPWAIKAAERGKHVLCEKPIALSAAKAETLIAARDRTGVKIQEAFMIRTHPQWLGAVGMARDGVLGRIESIVAHFSYHNVDAANVRNARDMGGGGLADIGCYLVHAARWVLGREPRRVASLMENDPVFGVDRLASMLMDFGDAHVVATCGTQMVPSQRVHILGEKARLEVEIPFNAPADRACRIFVDDGSSPGGASRRTVEFPACDQYTLQGDAFSEAIRCGSEQPLRLEDSVANMRTLDAIVRAAASGAWETP